MKTLTLVILLCAGVALSQLNIGNPFFVAAVLKPATAAPAGDCVQTNSISVTRVTSFGNTSNFTSYATAAFTPLSNELIVAFVTVTNTGPTLVTNTGTTQYTWWKAGTTNYNTLATPTAMIEAWVTQVPQDANPFSMQVVVTNLSGHGANMSVICLSGASTNTPWGTNAIIQTSLQASNSTANPRISITPSGDGTTAILLALADSVNSSSDNAALTPMTELSETAYNTPANGLSTYVMYQAHSVIALTNTATSRSWGALALEVKASTTNCPAAQDWLVMVTNYVNTASAVGGDGTTPATSGANRAFNSLSNALVALDSTLLTARRIECVGTTLDPWTCKQEVWDQTTSTTNFIWIVGDNTSGKWDTSKYRLEVTNGHGIYNNLASHVRIENMQVSVSISTSSGNNPNCYRLASANNASANVDHRFIGCIARMVVIGGATDNISGFIDSDPTTYKGTVKRINCLAYGGYLGFTSDGTGWGQTNVFNFNCTAVTNEYNFLDVQICQNCLSSMPSTGDGSGFLSTGSFRHFNNASDESSAQGLSSRINTTFTFVDVANRDFHLQSGDTGAKGFGWPAGYGSYTNDVDGTLRTIPWDIGYDKP